MSDTEPVHILSAEDIWAARDIEEKTVAVPEWGGSVKIRRLTLKQMASIGQRATRRNAQGQDDVNREMMVILTLQEGMIEPKLTVQDARRMSEKSAAAVTRIVGAINELGPTPAAVDEADKSVWPEPDAQIPIPIGARARDDVGSSDNGNVH